MDESPARRGPIGWGDALTAASRLGLASSRDLDFLVDLMGLSYPAVTEEPEPAAPVLTPDPEPRRPSDQDWTTAPVPRDELPVLQDRRTDVTELELQPFDIDVDLAEPLEASPPVMPPIGYQPPVPDRLLRASMSMLVRRLRSSDEIDLAQLVDLVAEQRPLSDLPRVFEPTTRHGVTVIADVGKSMLPFLADVDRLVAEIELVVGSPNTTVWWIDDDTPLANAAELQPILSTDRPVLVISTMGAVRAPGSPPDSVLRWLGFAGMAREAGADVVGLVPHRLRRWPRSIAEAVAVVAWDDLPQIGRGRA